MTRITFQASLKNFRKKPALSFQVERHFQIIDLLWSVVDTKKPVVGLHYILDSE